MKESIKKIVQIDGKISVSYKKKINQWFGEIKIFKIFCEELNGYEFIVEHGGWKKFNNIDDAVEYFCYHAYTSKNFGYIQNRLMDSGKIGEDEFDLERPSDELIEIFKEEGKLVDQEAAVNGIVKPKKQELTKEIAINEIKELIPTLTIDNIPETLSVFKRKYLSLDPYISMKAVFTVLSRNDEFSSGSNINHWTRQNIEKSKAERGHKNDLDFKTLRLTVKFDEEYENYDINV